MSATPRKSSIRSNHTSRSNYPRLPPSSLRVPSGRIPSPSAASLSLIFASHESSGSTSGPTSEEALAKQLDGDAGGRTMGLRSRRGSSATVRSRRTHSGVSASSVPEEAGEEDRQEAPVAGPSSPRELLVASPISSPTEEQPAQTTSAQRLNPKSSSSWMKWNSPAPTFPRSVSREKGKGKERERIPSATENAKDDSVRKEQSTAASIDPETVDTTPTPAITAATAAEDSAQTAPRLDTTTLDGPGTTTIPPPNRGRWWSRAAPVMPAPAAAEVSVPPEPSINQSVPAAASIAKAELPETPSAPTKSTKEISPTRSIHAAGTSPGSTIDSVATAPEHPENTAIPTTPTPEHEQARQPQQSGTQNNSSWLGYLGKSRQAPASSGTQTAKETQDVQVPAVTEEVIVQKEVARPAEEQMSGPEANVISSQEQEAQPGETAQASAPPKAGWGSYLYSFVATPVAPTSSTTASAADSARTETTVEVDPIKDQKSVPTTPPAVSVQAATPQPVTTSVQPPLPPAVASLASTPNPADGSPTQTRKGSTSSQSGWLNYLAFRASQKKLLNASTASIKSGKEKERKSLDGPEEVMDFSNDPNFPGSSGISIAPSAAEGDSVKDKAVAPSVPAQGAPINKKSTQALAVARGRRPSNGSTKSANLTPLSSSPKSKATPKTPSSSTLPGPSAPIPPAAQPNFVIPTFESTFDKPPRSLPSLPENTGGTSALAWKAIGAVGSYVYGPSDDVKEGKGMREGRRVGSGLPRKVGVGEAKGGLGPDDGWKQVKRVVVVGVHGWFPAKMLNSVIGEPTGTSVKFANMMGASVKRFFDERGVNDIRLTLMPLEGEGTIESRVDRLYKAYLANPAWINDLRRADAVFFAAHSQGCIVTTHLISRLIAQGHIRTPYNSEAVARCEWAFGLVSVVPETTKKRGPILSGSDGGYQKVAMLAMCGVHLGPLYSISTSTVIQPYLQWFENAAARELFEFQDTTSAVGAAYQKSLSMILENEVKVVLLASYNDQVVPIYGASFSTATHPLLLRALFVDGASYAASDFMTNLLAFAFMLRNAGIDDQGLVEHLSEATAGSLTGVGHSAPYEDKGAYDLTVKYMFLSGPAKHPMPALHVEPFAARDVRSDFELPWIMRALVDSPEVRDLFPAELNDLREGVVGWKPVTKALKEIKKRLEPMAGRQSRLRHQSSTASLGDGPNGAAAGPTALRRDW